jgi:hypothetical protein
MAQSYRKLKENTHFRQVDQKSVVPVESHNLLVAKKQNRLENEIYKKKVCKLEKETSSNLIKLSKSIYETSIELSRIKYELKRNMLETIYKNYSFCASYRNNKKKENEIVPNINNQTVENKETTNSKDDKLNRFLVDLSTKSEKEVDFLLNNRPKSTPFSSFKKHGNILLTTSEKNLSNIPTKQNKENKSANLRVKSASIAKIESKSSIMKPMKSHSTKEIDKVFKENTVKMYLSFLLIVRIFIIFIIIF